MPDAPPDARALRPASQIERLRQRAGGAAVELALRGLAATARAHPRARAAFRSVAVERDVPYRPTGLAAHRLDVYRPRGARRGLPVLLHIHGGGFRILSKDTHWLMGLGFARAGMLVFNVNYRLAPEHPFPAAVEDVSAAYRWVVEHAASWGGDPSRLFVAGESAGANLTTALTCAASFERPEPFARAVFETGVVPRAAMPFCGLLQATGTGRFDVPPFVRDRLKVIERSYLGEAPPPFGTAFADPLAILESDATPARPLPPFFPPVGTADPIADDTLRLKAALDRRGVFCEAPLYEGEPHAFHAFVFRPAARRCWNDAHAFIDRVRNTR